MISDGCNAKKPRLIHLCEPFIEEPINKTRHKHKKQKVQPISEKFIIDSFDIMEQNIITPMPTEQYNV